MSADPRQPRRASHRRRRRLIAGASLLALVIAARIAAPIRRDRARDRALAGPDMLKRLPGALLRAIHEARR